MTAAGSWAEVGERVRESRAAARLTQSELADRIGLDRTALAKIEAGTRQVSALELYRLSDELRLPIAHFVLRPPASVVSRRTALADEPDAAARSGYFLDADLTAHARDAEWLASHGFLPVGGLPRPTGSAADPAAGRELARRTRGLLGADVRPLGGLAGVCEAFGLYVLPVDRDAEGASLALDGFGVAVVGAQREPGRRRWTAAHELGHYLLGDAYSTDVGVAASERDREAVIDAFAGEFLLPEAAVRAAWGVAGDDRARLIDLAGRYRLSWSATVQGACAAGVLTGPDARALRADTPTRGDFQLVLGADPLADLAAGETGRAWRSAVLTAWQRSAVTPARAVELLHGQLGPDELPRRELPGDGA